jgi:signal transduction histidine kinase
LGLSKETAHQLGTPTSSLIAWVELLKAKKIDDDIVNELEKDVLRLEKITERFSKVGSKPVLKPQPIFELLNKTLEYLRSRVSEKVTLNIKAENKQLMVPVNPSLFEWVIENVCKNALDATEGKGLVTVEIKENPRYVHVDITDNGKGIPKGQFKTIFKPGFTTKQRGWGLGLSLSKRIIEEYHDGKIFVAQSEPNVGTTMRITLKKK